MILRIATFKTAPADDRDWVVEALKDVPGVRAAYHVIDDQSGELHSISLFDDERAMEAGHGAIAARAREIGHVGHPPDSTNVCRVVRYVENQPRAG